MDYANLQRDAKTDQELGLAGARPRRICILPGKDDWQAEGELVSGRSAALDPLVSTLGGGAGNGDPSVMVVDASRDSLPATSPHFGRPLR
ncbi:MAG TPA: hypothetical protein VH370_24705 [Humisphaera sp.]|nr:hypothetical protein [Humisphaera sp.]